MAIPIEILQKWARPGKNEMSSQTYHALREILMNKLDIPQSDIYLQGSYRNSTNVRDNSDIDIVVEFSPKYDVRYLKDYVYRCVQNANNFHFTTGSKTVKYKGLRNQYVPADIVPCVTVANKQDCVKIYDSSRGIVIENYPKVHIRNVENKSGRTSGNSKKAVRMLKNARNYLEDKGYRAGISSYTIECMVYNIPDGEFVGNEYDVYYHILNWLCNNKISLSSMKTQDGKNLLFYTGGRSANTASLFIDDLVNLWNNWGKV